MGLFVKASCFGGFRQRPGSTEMLTCCLYKGHTLTCTQKSQRCTNSSSGHKYLGEIAPESKQPPKEPWWKWSQTCIAFGAHALLTLFFISSLWKRVENSLCRGAYSGSTHLVTKCTFVSKKPECHEYLTWEERMILSVCKAVPERLEFCLVSINSPSL